MKKVDIIDFYPRDVEEEKSGFWAVFLEVDWDKIFVLKWTKKEKWDIIHINEFNK